MDLFSEITVEELINEETVQKLFILTSWIFSPCIYRVSFSGFLFAMATDFLTWPLTFFLTFIPQNFLTSQFSTPGSVSLHDVFLAGRVGLPW